MYSSSFKWSAAQCTLLLVNPHTGGVLGHATFTRGNEAEEISARRAIEAKRDGWNQLRSDGALEIRELERPASKRSHKKKEVKHDQEAGTGTGTSGTV